MPRELLLICGSDLPADRERRAALIRHAAAAAPGAVTHRFLATPHAAIALVESSPAGGDYAELRDTPEGARLHIATSELGLAVARREATYGASTGSEAGHVRVAVAMDGSVEVSTDGTAFLPCFWAEHGGMLYVATHLASLVSLGLPADADTDAVLHYLVMFHPLQHRTLLRHASLLPPGGHFRWTPGQGTRHTEQPLFVPSEESMTDDEALRTFRPMWLDVVGDVFKRNDESRIVLALSGGLDSRAIATASACLGIRPLSYTYGDDRNRETVVATELARRLELAHLTIPVTDDRRLTRADAIAARLDGAHGPAEMYESWHADLLRSFADVVINGLAGGPLWGDDVAVGVRDPAAALALTLGRYAGAPAAVAPFLRSHDANDVAEVLRSGIAQSMSVWDFSSRSDTAVYWRLANRQLRWGNMLGTALRRDGLRIEAPFLDSRFLRFAARLTSEQRLNGRLYLRVHREIFTRTADIRRSDDGNSPRQLSHVYWSGQTSHLNQLASLTREHPVAGARRGSRRAAQIGADVLWHRSGLRGPSDRLSTLASVFPADVWMRSRGGYADRLANLLERAVGAHPMLSEVHVARAVDEIRSGRPTASATTLAKVATVGAWLADYSARAEAAQQLSSSAAPSPRG